MSTSDASGYLRVQRVVDGGRGIGLDLGAHRLELVLGGDALFGQPAAEPVDRVAVRLPLGLFVLGAVVFAVDVADVVAVIAVGLQFDEERALALAAARDQLLRQFVDRQHVLPVDLERLDPEGLGAGGDRARGDLVGPGVFRIAVVFAGIDHRQLPERCHVHDLVHQALRGGAVAEETDGDIVAAPAAWPTAPTRWRCPSSRRRWRWRRGCRWTGRRCASSRPCRGNSPLPCPASSQNICLNSAPLATQWPWPRWVEVILSVGRQRLADADGDGLFAGIHMGQARHLGRQVQLVGVVLEGADADHLAVHPQIVFGVGLGLWRGS